MRKLLKLCAVACVACAPLSTQAAPILFDVNGDTAAGGVISIDGLDWAPDNALFDGAAPIPASPGFVDFDLVLQGSLAGFINSGAMLDMGAEITYSMRIPSRATVVGGIPGIEIVSHEPLGGGTMAIYYDDTGPGGLGTTGGNVHDDITGAGYDDGRLILTADVNTGTLMNTLILNSNAAATPLDQFGLDNKPGITTVDVSGNATYELDVDMFDPTFFLTDPRVLAGPDFDFTTDAVAPFQIVNPSAEVVGEVPDYGNDNVNDNQCTVVDFCDIQFETDARSPFFAQPQASVSEPTTLALIGLGLAGLGFACRRRVRA